MEFKELTEDNIPECGVEVLGFSKDWVEGNISPTGIRICFICDDGSWDSSKWHNDQGYYFNDEFRSSPTHYCELPNTSDLIKQQ